MGKGPRAIRTKTDTSASALIAASSTACLTATTAAAWPVSCLSV
ncbi:hypothetical protein cypCar_00037688 [Cyprinus carpio]|nr:hypothetical protein cypCar_00037688 [Cyprinus carpio]